MTVGQLQAYCKAVSINTHVALNKTITTMLLVRQRKICHAKIESNMCKEGIWPQVP